MKVKYGKAFLLFIAFIAFGMMAAKGQYATDSAEISLITASPGEETYAVFGHTSLRVNDKVQGYDLVFNYGTFDFSTENFYLKFSTGKLMYFLSIANYSDFIEAYHQNGQAIYVQPFNLSNKEKFTLINNLHENYREENRHFRYDFFRDNCATRIRDIIEKSVDGKIVYDTTYVLQRESFRKLFGSHLKNEPWIIFGLNLIMGKSTDSIASLHDYMYLPVHLKNLFASAKVVSANGSKALTMEPAMLFPSTIVIEKPPFYATPEFVCALLFLVILLVTIWEYRKGKFFKGIDIFLFTLTGLLGVLIFWLWTWSLHVYLHNNLHIIWATPLNLMAAVFLLFFSKNRWMHYYSAVYGTLIVLLVIASFFVVQEFAVASYFLMGIMLVRAARIYLKYNEEYTR